MAGRFPQADNVDEFWANIRDAKHCIDEIPAERWDIDQYYQAGEVAEGKINSRFMGAVNDYDKFDPVFFNISPKEAKIMDPQQRLFLQTCWHTIEHAGYNPKGLSGEKCGVFVGVADGDYLRLAPRHQLSALGFTGGEASILSARIAYFLNFTGPCLSINTACSSSLVATANACDSLNSGQSDMALAGGVNIMNGPSMLIKSAQAGMLSPDGKCYTFDERANGFVAGEAVGVVMLKRLADAEADRDNILGVVEGWGINQDGKTNGITAPNAQSQTALQQAVYQRHAINPEHIQLIEAHGTGTALGDPIEVAGLKAAFGTQTQKTAYCALGSVKAISGIV